MLGLLMTCMRNLYIIKIRTKKSYGTCVSERQGKRKGDFFIYFF